MKNFENFLIFSQNMKKIRKTAQLTQREMAQKLGISIASLSKIEKGILPPRLSCSILIRIHKEFGIHPKDLFEPLVSD